MEIVFEGKSYLVPDCCKSLAVYPEKLGHEQSSPHCANQWSCTDFSKMRMCAWSIVSRGREPGYLVGTRIQTEKPAVRK